MEIQTKELIELIQKGRNTLEYINEQELILESKIARIKSGGFFRSEYLIEDHEVCLRVWQSEEHLVRKELVRCINAMETAEKQMSGLPGKSGMVDPV